VASLQSTPNLLTAQTTGEVGGPQRHHRGLHGRGRPHHRAGRRVPCASSSISWDNKEAVSNLNSKLFVIIMQAMIIGLLISLLLSFLLSKAMVGPH
jgi:two-component system sensor histidine kinase VicK